MWKNGALIRRRRGLIVEPLGAGGSSVESNRANIFRQERSLVFATPLYHQMKAEADKQQRCLFFDRLRDRDAAAASDGAFTFILHVVEG